MSNLSWQKTHLRDILWLAIQKHQPNCYLCHKPFTMADFPIRKTDLITEHHIDGNHMNMKLENRTLTHRSCHKSYHLSERRRSGLVCPVFILQMRKISLTEISKQNKEDKKDV